MHSCSAPPLNPAGDAQLHHSKVRLRLRVQVVVANWRTSNGTRRRLAEDATLVPCAARPHQIWLAPSKRQQDSYAISNLQDRNGVRFYIVLQLPPIGSLFAVPRHNQNAALSLSARPLQARPAAGALAH